MEDIESLSYACMTVCTVSVHIVFQIFHLCIFQASKQKVFIVMILNVNPVLIPYKHINWRSQDTSPSENNILKIAGASVANKSCHPYMKSGEGFRCAREIVGGMLLCRKKH